MKKMILMLFIMLYHNLAFAEGSNQLMEKLKKSQELVQKSIKKQDQAINYAKKISKKESINISDSNKLCSMVDEVYDLRQEAMGYMDSIDLSPEQLESTGLNESKSTLNNLLQEAANAKVSSGCQQLKEQQAGIDAAEKWVQFNKSLGCEELWKIKQDCAVAGDIKECIRIRKQGRSFIGC